MRFPVHLWKLDAWRVDQWGRGAHAEKRSGARPELSSSSRETGHSNRRCRGLHATGVGECFLLKPDLNRASLWHLADWPNFHIRETEKASVIKFFGFIVCLVGIFQDAAFLLVASPGNHLGDSPNNFCFISSRIVNHLHHKSVKSTT